MPLAHLYCRSRQAALLLARLDAAAPPPGPLPAGWEWDWDAALARLDESGAIIAPALELDSASMDPAHGEGATAAAGRSAAAGKLGSGHGGHDLGNQGSRQNQEDRAPNGSAVRQSGGGVGLSDSRSVSVRQGVGRPVSSGNADSSAKAVTVRLSDGLRKSIRQSGAGNGKVAGRSSVVRQSDSNKSFVSQNVANGNTNRSWSVGLGPRKSSGAKHVPPRRPPSSVPALDHSSQQLKQDGTHVSEGSRNADAACVLPSQEHAASDSRDETNDSGARVAAAIPADTRSSTTPTEGSRPVAADKIASEAAVARSNYDPDSSEPIAARLTKSRDSPPCSNQPDLEQPASPGAGDPTWISRHKSDAEHPGSGSNSCYRQPDSHPVRLHDSGDDSSSCYHSGNSSLRASWQDQEAAAAQGSIATLSVAAAAAQKCQAGKDVLRDQARGHEQGEGSRHGSAHEEEHHGSQQELSCDPHQQHARAHPQSYAGQLQRKEELLRTPRQGPQLPVCASPAQRNPIQSASRGSTPSQSSIKAARSLDFGGKSSGSFGGRVGRPAAVARSVAVAGARGGPRGASSSPSRAGSGYAQQHEAATIARNNGGRTSLQVCIRDD